MNLREEAVVFREVCKTYKLYENQSQMILDALGFNKKKRYKEFHALKNIEFNVKKGERLGIVGRNGAGKSTLLKLITGNFLPTSGEIEINGKVQALMSIGLGFHPEFTGMENIKSSLMYNGLQKQDYEQAINEIIDFVELGEFIDQPFKNYSLGMQSRLYFAVSTAIQPEILIIDEVLGAGDAYFSAKSAERMEKLTNSGCTLLLVSHSTQQVLQFCDKAIWLECGEIVKSGTALEVVKLYEEYSKKLEVESKQRTAMQQCEEIEKTGVIQSPWLREKILKEVLSITETPFDEDAKKSEGGVSRWKSTAEGILISSVRFLDKDLKPCYLLQSGQKLVIEIEFGANISGVYDCYFVVVIFSKAGMVISRHRSQKYELMLETNQKYTTRFIYEEILLGSGDYLVSVAIFKDLGDNRDSTTSYYDLLSRSFEFKINNFNDDPSIVLHPAQWELNSSNTSVHIKEECASY